MSPLPDGTVGRAAGRVRRRPPGPGTGAARGRWVRLPALLLGAVLALVLGVGPAQGRELRRQMTFLRPMLMGDAYVAVGDEASTLLYNPAGLARVQEATIEVPSLQFAADRQLADLLLNPGDVQAQYSARTLPELQALVGTSLFYDTTLHLPFLYLPGGGTAYGIGLETLGAVEVVEDSLGLPALQLEAFVDQTVLWSWFGGSGGFSVGGTFKLINRAGINKVIDAATLYASGTTADLNNDPDYQALRQGKTRVRAGLDLGFLYQFPGADVWQPRIALAIQNFGGKEKGRTFHHGYKGIEFGDKPDADTPSLYGDLPLNVTVGFAVSPTFAGIRYTFAVDMVDVAETAIPGDSRNNRTRIGFEMGIGPHPDGTALFSVLMGWNATHFSVGVLSRVWIFEIGFGRYEVEKGTYPGENPEERRVLLFALRF